MRHNLFLCLSALVLLSACAKPEPKEQSVIGEPLQRAMERAESVEATLQQHADDMRRRVEEAEGR
jgi:outer membrane lipoprotein-sorting protein